MAEIRPFRAWRYNPEIANNIDDLTSPLFDVVSERQRNRLYANPYNSIHLSVPSGSKPAEQAKTLLAKWKKDNVIQQDHLPGIYVYYQYFSLPGSTREYCRKGFICMIKAYHWREEVVLRHENTMPVSVNDRKDLLAATKLNVSPTHGLYTDPNHSIEQYLDESMQHPVYETEDYQGVRDKLSIIHDANVIKKIIGLLKDKQVILADGHHRYEGSMLYRQEQMDKNPNDTGREPYHYHLMYLTNTESDDLRILPTHRLVRNVAGIKENTLLDSLQEYFLIKNVDNVSDIPEIILGKQWAFGLIIGDNCYKIRLKPELINTISWRFPDEIKRLDLTVMHYFLFEKILGIKGIDQRGSDKVFFERNFTECHTKVLNGEAQFAIITKDIPMDTVKQVCYSGYTLPQKSTYFYPKVISGFLFCSIDENEFHAIVDPSFQ